jgi:hypothetical protein
MRRVAGQVDFSELDEVLGQLGALFGLKRDGPRLLPIEAPPRLYRDGKEEWREIAFKRRAPCDCKKGCSTCSYLKWRIASEKVRVKIPAGSDVGTRLQLSAKGVQLELVELGSPRAEELAAQGRAYEDALEQTWRKLGKERRAERRQQRASIVVGIALTAGCIGLVSARSTPPPRIYTPITIPSFTPMPVLVPIPPRNDELVELPAPAYHSVELLPAATVMPPPGDVQTRFIANGLVALAQLGPATVRRTDATTLLRKGQFRTAYAMSTDARGQTTTTVGSPFWVRRVTTNGKWSFLEAQTGDARAVIGMSESGEATITGPKTLKGRVSVFGRALHHNLSTGAYEEAETPGRWTCAKLTLDLGNDETTELYVAFDPKERVGELITKDFGPAVDVTGLRTATPP